VDDGWEFGQAAAVAGGEDLPLLEQPNRSFDRGAEARDRAVERDVLRCALDILELLQRGPVGVPAVGTVAEEGQVRVVVGGGTDLVAGDYQTALAALTKPKRKLAVRDPLTTSTNLCVAYTMTKQWEMARTACDEAITEAKHERLRSPAWTYSTRLKQNSYVALAYSNRAVLNWLSNNSAGAEQDLSSAAAYAPKADFVARNLAALRSAPSTLAQAVVAPQK